MTSRRVAAAKLEEPSAESFAEHESFLQAEREARWLALETAITHVVVEVRDLDDAPGIEATFVVCPVDQVDDVLRGREVVFRADVPTVQPGAASSAIREALRLCDQALQVVDQRSGPSVQDLLRAIQRCLRAAHDPALASGHDVAPARSRGSTTTRTRSLDGPAAGTKTAPGDRAPDEIPEVRGL